uniref:Uncharacterized protein n=1 Tax=Brassica oleracea TaxID=3712 RepID=A0A3P6BUW7_BRAOL|nr:unnamed protein product [Brassica oleracea]
MVSKKLLSGAGPLVNILRTNLSWIVLLVAEKSFLGGRRMFSLIPKRGFKNFSRFWKRRSLKRCQGRLLLAAFHLITLLWPTRWSIAYAPKHQSVRNSWRLKLICQNLMTG